MDVPKLPRRSRAAARVPRLTSLNLRGRPYTRRTDVEVAILHALERPPADWAAMARLKGEERLPDEALVFLVRAIQNENRDLFGSLIDELCRRVARVAKGFAQGFDSNTTDEIVLEVANWVIDMILSKTRSRQSEFLEIAFKTGVKRRTINIVEKYQRRPATLPYLRAESSDGEEASESLAEQVKDENPGPEAILLHLEDDARRPKLVKDALAAVKDRRHVEAVILRYVRGWPMTDKDSDKPSLVRHFGKSARQIQNWIHDALEAMRAAIGDKI
jgi:DNA-directed RNA polymerase specialized sigma24 family protein